MRGFLKLHSAILSSAIALFAVMALAGCAGGTINDRLSVKADFRQLRDGDCEEINQAHPGARIELNRFVKYGKYTVFDFSSPY